MYPLWLSQESSLCFNLPWSRGKDKLWDITDTSTIHTWCVHRLPHPQLVCFIIATFAEQQCSISLWFCRVFKLFKVTSPIGSLGLGYFGATHSFWVHSHSLIKCDQLMALHGSWFQELPVAGRPHLWDSSEAKFYLPLSALFSLINCHLNVNDMRWVAFIPKGLLNIGCNVWSMPNDLYVCRTHHIIVTVHWGTVHK